MALGVGPAIGEGRARNLSQGGSVNALLACNILVSAPRPAVCAGHRIECERTSLLSVSWVGERRDEVARWPWMSKPIIYDEDDPSGSGRSRSGIRWSSAPCGRNSLQGGRANCGHPVRWGKRMGSPVVDHSVRRGPVSNCDWDFHGGSIEASVVSAATAEMKQEPNNKCSVQLRRPLGASLGRKKR